MILKIFSNVFLGLKGIYNNKRLWFWVKLLLYLDYFKLVIMLLLVITLKKKINSVRLWSFNYTIYVGNFVTFFYMFNEVFCKSVYSYFRINSFYDLGTNIGLVTLWYKYFNRNLKVVTFEPDKYNFKLLLKNIKANHLTNVTVHNIALYNKKSRASFFTIIDDIQNLDSGLTLNQDLPHKTYMVKTDKLSHYIDQNIDLVKIDIEGAEYAVFEDLFATGKINRLKNIIFEAHFFNQEQRQKLQILIRNLKKIGEIKELENSSLTTIFYFSRQ